MAYQSTHTGAQVDEAVGKALNPDAEPTEGSTNLVESGGVFDALAPLRSVDAVPTPSSTNLVQSGGVSSALANLHVLVYEGTMPASETTAVTQSVPGANNEWSMLIALTAQHSGNGQWYQLAPERFANAPVMNNGNLRFTGVAGGLSNFLNAPYRAFILTK